MKDLKVKTLHQTVAGLAVIAAALCFLGLNSAEGATLTALGLIILAMASGVLLFAHFSTRVIQVESRVAYLDDKQQGREWILFDTRDSARLVWRDDERLSGRRVSYKSVDTQLSIHTNNSIVQCEVSWDRGIFELLNIKELALYRQDEDPRANGADLFYYAPIAWLSTWLRRMEDKVSDRIISFEKRTNTDLSEREIERKLHNQFGQYQRYGLRLRAVSD